MRGIAVLGMCGALLVGCVQSHSLSPSASPGPTATLPEYQGFRKAIAIEPESVRGSVDLANFPLLLSIEDDAELAGRSPSTFVFAVDQQELNYEIEKYDPESGSLVAWVSLPALKVDETTRFYLYYGDDAIEPQSESALVWDIANFVAVWHLEEDAVSTGNPAVYRDSTSHGHDADDFVLSTGQLGAIEAGQQFDAGAAPMTADRAVVSDQADPWDFDDKGLDAGNSDMTLSAWIHYTAAAGFENLPSILRKGAGSAAQAGYWWHYTTQTDTMGLFLSSGTDRAQFASSTLALIPGEWRHWTVVVRRGGPADEVEFFVDGASVGTQTSNLVSGRSLANGLDLGIGGRGASAERGWSGYLDEVRVSGIARTADWIATEFANQSEPEEFTTTGSAQPVGQ